MLGNRLSLIKSIHAILFILMSFCIVYIFYCGITKTYNLILFIAIGSILVEGLVLLLNNWQCPLTNLAREYGDETGRVTDMFFPAWFVPHVFQSCTALFIIGVVLLVIRYMIG